MSELKEFLANSESERFQNVLKSEISEFEGLHECSSFNELRLNFHIVPDILGIVFISKQIESRVFELVQDESAVRKYRILSRYLPASLILLAATSPLILENYWLYFGLLLFPVAMYSAGLIKKPPLFWLVIIGVSLYSVYSGILEILIMVFLSLIYKFSLSNALKHYRDKITEAAKKNELNFKFLYTLGLVALNNKKSNSFLYHKNKQD